MQNLQFPAPETKIKDSLPGLLNSMRTIMSNNSGSSFPTTELQLGQFCYRQDQGAIYMLKTIDEQGIATWVKVIDLSGNPTTAEAMAAALKVLSDTMSNSGLGTAGRGKLLTNFKDVPVSGMYSGYGDGVPAANGIAPAANGPQGTGNTMMGILALAVNENLVYYVVVNGAYNIWVGQYVKSTGLMGWDQVMRKGNLGSAAFANTGINTGNLVPFGTAGFHGGNCEIVGDWNAARGYGQRYYMAPGTAANSPPGGTWYMGQYIEHNGNWGIQEVWAFEGTGKRFWRAYQNGTWGPWQPVYTGAWMADVYVRGGDITLGYEYPLPGSYIRMVSGNVYIPTHASKPLPIGSQFTIRQQSGTPVQIIPWSGVNLNTPETNRTRKGNSTVTVVKVGNDDWDLMGDLELA